MTDIDEPRVDLGPLGPDARFRAERVALRVMQRIEGGTDSVRGRLAGFALPALLAAAASLVLLLLSRPREPESNPFAVLVVGPGPARAWITFKRAPDLNEVRTMMEGGR